MHLRAIEAAIAAGRSGGFVARVVSAMPSTVIRSFSYDAERGDLDVLFVTGRRYRYYGVPPDVATDMKRAFAKGEFFNAEIRDRYRFTRLDPSGDKDRKVTE
jgi:hypothetical protein